MINVRAGGVCVCVCCGHDAVSDGVMICGAADVMFIIVTMLGPDWFDTQRTVDPVTARLAASLHQCFALVQETSRRWTSFGLVADLGHGFDCGTWHTFRTSRMEDEVKAYMTAGHLRLAITLWRRHASAALAAFAASCVAYIPRDTPVHAFAPWLRDEVVPLLNTQQRDALATWLTQRAVEVEARTGSPQDALLLATVLGGASMGVMMDQAKQSPYLEASMCVGLVGLSFALLEATCRNVLATVVGGGWWCSLLLFRLALHCMRPPHTCALCHACRLRCVLQPPTGAELTLPVASPPPHKPSAVPSLVEQRLHRCWSHATRTHRCQAPPMVAT